MADKTMYLCRLSFGGRDGKTYKRGDVVELDDNEAKVLNRHKAITMYFGEDEEAPETVLPRPVRKKPNTPKKLDNSKTVTPDPRAK